MSYTPSTEPLKAHRRDIRRQIILPMVIPALLLVGLLIGLLVLFAAGTLGSHQIMAVAGIMIVIFVLLPAALLMFVLVGILVYLALGSQYLYAYITPPLRTVRGYSERTAAFTRRASEKITDPVIRWRVRFERWRYALGLILGLPNLEEGTQKTDD